MDRSWFIYGLSSTEFYFSSNRTRGLGYILVRWILVRYIERKSLGLRVIRGNFIFVKF